MWRFALAPGVCGEQAWAGLLLPSVDKVGRYYPLTFALPAPAQSGLFVDLFKAQDWYSALEDVALSALNVDFSVEQLERALSEITSALAPADERAASAACDLIADLRGRTAVAAFACPAADVSQTVQAAASALFESAAASRSFWWHIGRDSAASDLHCAHGLPSPEYFAVLLGAGAVDASLMEGVSSDPLQALDLDHTPEDYQPAAGAMDASSVPEVSSDPLQALDLDHPPHDSQPAADAVDASSVPEVSSDPLQALDLDHPPKDSQPAADAVDASSVPEVSSDPLQALDLDHPPKDSQPAADAVDASSVPEVSSDPLQALDLDHPPKDSQSTG